MSRKKAARKSDRIVIVFMGVVILVALSVLIFSLKSLLSQKVQSLSEIKSSSQNTFLASGFTQFDRELAIQLMDKNNDGQCDECGMPVEMCINTGQLQCNMDSESTIGVLGSQHIHADWKVYINGELSDFTDKAHMDRMRNNLPVSSFIHVDSGAPAPEKTGDVLHMHATGVPLWIFFESIELKLPDGMKVYVNGKEIVDWKNYVFNDLDKILITDGKGNLQEQLRLITDFAKIH